MAIARDRASGREAARLVRERLPGKADGVSAAAWLRGEPRAVALSGGWLGGATILSSHPLAIASPGDDPFATVASMPRAVDLDRVDPSTVIGGGWFGWLGFGLAGLVEPVPPPPPRRLQLPLFDLAFHDFVVLRDSDDAWWFECLWTPARAAVLSERLACWRDRLSREPPARRPFTAEPLRPVPPGLRGHQAAVADTIRRIVAGEFSQANVCLRLEAGHGGDPLDLWMEAATGCRPAYGAFVSANTSGHAIVSLSPELFLRRTGADVLTRPIKGTAPLTDDPATLATSRKDRAENVMIVDLMRNDLGRVCSYGTVRVEELCQIRRAPGVWHLESAVRGTLRPTVGDEELLRATFPPGSVTGAPKVQALRTIHALEASAREAYCGAIGLCSPVAGLELSVAIRTFELTENRLWLGVGGGIVADSSPGAEVSEALAKARGVISAAGLELAHEPLVDATSHTPLDGVTRPDPGLGVFETIRVASGHPTRLSDHLARLAASSRQLELSLPIDLEEQVVATAAGLGAAALRVTVIPGSITLTSRPLPAAEEMELVPLIVPGGLGAHKWADRRLIEAHTSAGSTPLICDLDGSALETGYAAVLLAIADGIVAPPLDGRLLPSISRAHLLARAAQAGWHIDIRTITVQDLIGADAIILTSSLRGPHPGHLRGRSASLQARTICAALTQSIAID
jgi:para-aminobenzoate synthetase / 4-amino-4-deoxychorismate lyase